MLVRFREPNIEARSASEGEDTALAFACASGFNQPEPH